MLAYVQNIIRIDNIAILITLETKMSGREDRTTQQVHFWKSNCLLELSFPERIDSEIQAFFKEGNLSTMVKGICICFSPTFMNLRNYLLP